MKAEELRIGNWVWNPVQKIPVQVDIRLLNDIFYYEKAKKYSGWEPIPLTEQWLLDFGFERGVDYWSKDNVILDIFTNGLQYTWSLANIDYVHQLQNLYFALTGNELKLKYDGKGKH